MSKTVIVTGSTRSIGKAIAVRLLHEGHNVVLNYWRDQESAETTFHECQRISLQTILVKADVACKADVENLVRKTLNQFGSIDVLINNAGLNMDLPFFEMTEYDWERVIATNMKGVFLCSQIAARHILQQEQGGIILNVGATTAIRGRTNGINYCASKAGVLVMTKCLALELAPRIRVNCIIPGLIETDESREKFRLDDPGCRKAREEEIPLGYVGFVEEVAGVASFLISDAAKYINGQKIIVDGGQFMY